jgi:hypothetical protein
MNKNQKGGKLIAVRQSILREEKKTGGYYE